MGKGKGIMAGRQFSLSYAKLDQARKGKPESREWKQASKREGIAMSLFLFYLLVPRVGMEWEYGIWDMDHSPGISFLLAIVWYLSMFPSQFRTDSFRGHWHC